MSDIRVERVNRAASRAERRGLILDWIGLIICGGAVLLSLLADALDGTPLVLFTSTAEFPGPSWAVVFNAIIASLSASGLVAHYRKRR